MIMLTKENCPKCDNLKNYLKFALNSKYDDKIKIIKKEDDIDLFNSLVKEYKIMATPVLIAKDGTVLTDCSPSKVEDFLIKYQ